jgi:hypothetical protein
MIDSSNNAFVGWCWGGVLHRIFLHDIWLFLWDQIAKNRMVMLVLFLQTIGLYYNIMPAVIYLLL